MNDLIWQKNTFRTGIFHCTFVPFSESNEVTFKSRMRVPLQIVMVYQNTILGFIKLAFVYEWMAFSNLGVEENLLTEPELLPELWPKKLGCYLWSVTVGSSSILIVLAASFPSAIVFCMKFSQERSMGKDWTGLNNPMLVILYLEEFLAQPNESR